MANRVTGQILGGEAETMDSVFTPAQVLQNLGQDPAGFSAAVNGEASDLSAVLDDYDFVSFSRAVKNG